MTHAARVDDLKKAFFMLDQHGNAIASHARHIVDNGDPFAAEPVEILLLPTLGGQQLRHAEPPSKRYTHKNERNIGTLEC